MGRFLTKLGSRHYKDWKIKVCYMQHRLRTGMSYQHKHISRLESHRTAISNLGIEGYIYRIFAKRLGGKKLTSKHLQHPVYIRPQTSDVHVFEQIFVEREYQILDEIKNPDLIIDCGSNVGYSSAYFLSRYPAAEVIAIEPESGNFQQLAINLAPYSNRVRTIQAGVWSKSTRLALTRADMGNEWGFQVEEDPCGQLIALDINSILRSSGRSRISLVKIDIEGSEIEVFSSNVEWIDSTDAIVIELHGEKCEAAFRKAIANKGFRISTWGELTFAVR